ncbi:hypothetical protein CROQUDRAFT_49034 [Cronartium quercuum f. sp. fusiforme G11]|uniref:Glycosyl transferase CAP10 domain-containing protein n=1 Tax=Cronartium quercuum f. sp. fusiforme G11 TaxID=708437 RepID=A0A9P6T8S1_9BASI|nr:hypothetical protein CROQUDRAFT_49034 [Cronartium quercuum f. sp. fusiforme G11]
MAIVLRRPPNWSTVQTIILIFIFTFIFCLYFLQIDPRLHLVPKPDLPSYASQPSVSEQDSPVDSSSLPQPLINLRYSVDGLVYFLDHPSKFPSPTIQHPIFSLIQNATEMWNSKLRKQSETLCLAAIEYHRRHQRHPPRGFDKWWIWAKNHHVQLLDEYDSMFKAIEPFFALPPKIFRQRVDDLLYNRTKWKADTIVISIKTGKVILSGHRAHNGQRPTELMKLLEGIAHLLPDVELPISTMDLPAVLVSSKSYERHVQLARQSDYLPVSEISEIYEEPGLHGWPNTCPPESRLRRALDGGHLYVSSSELWTQSYIFDHVPAMNVCDHPELEQLIGFLSMTKLNVHPYFPLFSFSKPYGFSEIPITPTAQYSQPTGPDPLWEQKTSLGLLWRGSTTGITFDKSTNWLQSQRTRLVKFANLSTGNNITIRIVNPKTGKLGYFNANGSALNSKYFDIGFTGQPLQCHVQNGICAALSRLFTFKEVVDAEATNKYKYILDVDGNGWSGRFHRLMTTKSVILKSTIFPEWYVYADRIQPWYHYVPVRVNYQDLYDIMAFFTGDLEGRGAQDEEAKKIGEAGSTWAKTFWRTEDMQAYMYRLILEYARLLKRDEQGMDYLCDER